MYLSCGDSAPTVLMLSFESTLGLYTFGKKMRTRSIDGLGKKIKKDISWLS